MPKTTSKAKKKEPASVLAVARMNDRAQPIERGDLYEDPLQEMLETTGIGEVTGGGTQVDEKGEIEFCDIEIYLQDTAPATINALIGMLEKLGCPKGSKLLVEGREVPFGQLEGLAVYFNGTELPDKVYQECDINHVFAEFERLLGKQGKIHSTWGGPTETAFYLFGKSCAEMRKRLSAFMASYPLCQKARLVQIA